jgi:hypothetical protein
MNIKLISIISIAQFLLIGCASYNYTDAPPSLGMMYSKYAYIGYEGELRPIEDVGIITTDGLVKVKSVDGYSVDSLNVFKTSGLYSGGRVQLHLLSGVHTLILGYHDDRGGGSISWSTSNITKKITIAKGQVIHLVGGSTGNNWTATERDGSSAIGVITSDFKDLTKNK